VDGEGDAVVALVRVAAEDVLVFTNFLTLLLARTLPSHLASVGFYFLRAELFLRIVALLGLYRHKGGAVEALVARLLGQGLVGQAGLRAGLRAGDGAGHRGGDQEDQHDEAADPSLLSLHVDI